jgi:hypothetical protein
MDFRRYTSMMGYLPKDSDYSGKENSFYITPINVILEMDGKIRTFIMTRKPPGLKLYRWELTCFNMSSQTDNR